MPRQLSNFTTSQAVTGSFAAGRGIRRLTRPVVAYIIGEPTTYAGFGTFCCGDPDTKEAVREVQRTAERLHTGNTTMTQMPVVVRMTPVKPSGIAASIDARPSLPSPGLQNATSSPSGGT